MMTCLSGVETVARSSASNEVTRQTITCQHHANDVLPAGWLTTRSEVKPMAKQICKDCAGRGWIAGPLYAMEGSYKCPTCDGTGTIHRTGPYRLTDGTWSDGVDRDEPLSVWTLPNGRWQVYRCGSGYWEAYAEIDGQQLDEIEWFPTHAEAVAYADHHARTTKNGDAA